ncbi:MAG TPA: STAS domain-containing protein [Tepidisphaeraceae bacterium]|nr:STAS domain-containing protein [Tepidisphaeraceae bacterium]
MVAQDFAIIPKTHRFTHPDAQRIYRAVLRTRHRSVVIDLSRADDATTSAFARLVLLRRELLRRGRDLRLVGLRDRVQKVYEVNRLASVLPCD